MESVQLISITPDELVSRIASLLIPELTKQLSEQFQPKQPEELLTIDELCSLLKIDRSTEHRWKKKGTIKPSIIEGSVYYFRSEIETLLNNNKIK